LLVSLEKAREKKKRPPVQTQQVMQTTEVAADVDADRAGEAEEVRVQILHAAPVGARKAVRGDEVRMNYEGTLPDNQGKKFDAGDIDFVIGDGTMLRGFDVGVCGMAVGETRLMQIPPKMGYGKKGKRGRVPSNANLLFRVIMLDAGIDWESKAKSNITAQQREAAKRRGKKRRPP